MYDVLSATLGADHGRRLARRAYGRDARARFRPALYDDERHRARPSAPQARPSVQPDVGITRVTREVVGALSMIPKVGPGFRIGSCSDKERLALRQFEKMPPGLVLGLDDPDVGIERDLLLQALFDLAFFDGLRR